jgi:membrane protein implicated in regulation of membrane protease activity
VGSWLLRPVAGVIMGSWIVWLVLAALLGVAEVMTTTLAFGLLAVAAVVAAVVGGVGLGLPFQMAAFAVAAAITSSSLRCCGPEHPPWSGGLPP